MSYTREMGSILGAAADLAEMMDIIKDRMRKEGQSKPADELGARHDRRRKESGAEGYRLWSL